jgi:hypothetical protein
MYFVLFLMVFVAANDVDASFAAFTVHVPTIACEILLKLVQLLFSRSYDSKWHSCRSLLL